MILHNLLAKDSQGDVIELLIYYQSSVKSSLTLRPFGVLGYVAGHSLTNVKLPAGLGFNSRGGTYSWSYLRSCACDLSCDTHVTLM